jgi:hypothetical protein
MRRRIERGLERGLEMNALTVISDAVLAPNQNIENNPMQSSSGVAGTDALPAKTF